MHIVRKRRPAEALLQETLESCHIASVQRCPYCEGRLRELRDMRLAAHYVCQKVASAATIQERIGAYSTKADCRESC